MPFSQIYDFLIYLQIFSEFLKFLSSMFLLINVGLFPFNHVGLSNSLRYPIGYFKAHIYGLINWSSSYVHLWFCLNCWHLRYIHGDGNWLRNDQNRNFIDWLFSVHQKVILRKKFYNFNSSCYQSWQYGMTKHLRRTIWL